MKKSSVAFAALALIWSIYYLAMRRTGGLLNRTDLLVCGTVALLCIGWLLYNLAGLWRKKE